MVWPYSILSLPAEYGTPSWELTAAAILANSMCPYGFDHSSAETWLSKALMIASNVLASFLYINCQFDTEKLIIMCFFCIFLLILQCFLVNLAFSSVLSRLLLKLPKIITFSTIMFNGFCWNIYSTINCLLGYEYIFLESYMHFSNYFPSQYILLFGAFFS
jgi:hypothetical protein